MIDPLTRKLHEILQTRQRRAIEARDPYAVGSSVGSVRSRNEDTGLICRVRFSDRRRDYDLAVVCDGMGGMQGGRAAALIAAATFTSRYISLEGRRVDERLRNSVMTAQARVLETLRGNGGTTLSGVVVQRTAQPWTVHVGDSRIYMLAQDDLSQLTSDQTLGALLKGGEGRPDAHRLVQFVGMDDELEPQISTTAATPSSGFLLTSDGAHGAPHDILRRVARHARDGSDAIRRLLSLADLLGGVDNATGIYLPSVLEDETTDAPFGMSISILTAAGDHDIWMPSEWLAASTTPHVRATPPPAPNAASEPQTPPSPRALQANPDAAQPPSKGAPAKTKKKATKPRGKSKATSGPASNSPEEATQVSLKFLEDGQE